jgi:diguanylate cyclase (GGDEF)-like protein/PAS domain S-box-containing protein
MNLVETAPVDSLAYSAPGLLVLIAALVALSLALAVWTFICIFKLRQSRAGARNFHELYENIGDGVFRTTLDGRMISANPALVRLNGYDSETEMVHSVRDISREWYVDPSRRAELHEILLRLGRVSNFISEVYRHKTRERIWIEETTRLVRDQKTGTPLYYDGTVREVTETMRRLQLQDRYDKIASVISGCLYQFRCRPDGSFGMPYASVGLVHIFGVKPEDVVEDASVLFNLIHPDDIERVKVSIEYSEKTLSVWQCEFRVRAADGSDKWIFGNSVPEREPDGSTLCHGFLTDVTERKQSEARIYDLAYFDPLTRLPNRTMLLDRLRQALSWSERTGLWGAVIFIGLDQFKLLNDTKGHHVGDMLLFETARRIQANVGRDDIVARYGGDEFVVILQNLPRGPGHAAVEVEAVASDILAAVKQPVEFDRLSFQTTASIGAVLFHGSERGLEELFKRANLAMFETKAWRRGSMRFFEPEMQSSLEQRLALTIDLRNALESGGLSLEYQPQIDSEGRCFAVEALLRWRHSERGEISPDEFLPLAERAGLMSLIDDFVLASACATLRQWADDPSTRDIRLAVNISAEQVNPKTFTAAIESALESSGANPARLTIELTEHVMLNDINEVSAIMRQLKQRGIEFALDDFGTGYSSLSYLKRLPIDTIKIDRSFINDLESDPSDRAIVQTVVNIARNLGVSVIAEGVETEVQAAILRELGCPTYQGYLFGAPMALDDFSTWFAASRTRAASGVSSRLGIQP